MDSNIAKLVKYKQLVGIAVAGIILTVIFVPLQRAEAFTIDLTLPGTTGNVVTQSTAGSDFTTTITVSPGELIQISSIDVIIDNTLDSVKRSTFSPTGAFVSGSTGAVIDNSLTVTSSTTQNSGYGYGFGYVSSAPGFSAPYSYSFTSSTNGFIGGNNLGYSNPAGGTNFAPGYIGPATITISGKINTAIMSPSSHTITTIVNTGSGGTGVDRLVPDTQTFTVQANAAVIQQTVNAGTNVSLPPINVPGLAAPITVTISNVQTGGTVAVEQKSASTLLAETPGIFSAVGTSSSLTIGTSTGNTIGTILDIDTSSIVLGAGATIDVTIPYDPTLLPSGFNEANVKFFHWTGTTWEDVTLTVDTAANTVTGRLTSLSPVVAGYTSVAPSGGGAVGGGGGGTTGGGTGIDLTPTYPDSYFVNNPLAKVQVQSTAFIGSSGQAVAAARTGGQIDIQATFKNYQQSSQNYAIIIQVIDKDGFTADVGWVTGTLASGETTNAARSWVAGDAGNYTVRIFVWDGISQTPTALSIVNDKTLTVVS